ncbi:MAG: AAA-like domain-containing protein [Candidatus Aminicenantes bacterium]|nr:AAA-like domain-containing protein [Candidatus Aminicenantes bacterium]
MRRFYSYGSVNIKLHYYAPREELLEKTYNNLVGENPAEGGHYFTVWAPRQTGKTWIMQQILFRLKKDPRFYVLKLNLEILKDQKKVSDIIKIIAKYIGEGLGKKFKGIDNVNKFQEIFKKDVLDKPLILILDEFDALAEEGINAIVSAFRNIYFQRTDEVDIPTEKKTYLLHGAALIGVRSVLGIENQKGSPFNVQRSLHIPNLTYPEVDGMFKWYEKESGQQVEEAVVRELYEETRGQPGLTCWFGELLTETYNHDPKKPITMDNFREAYGAATHILPNNNILNLISKVNKPPYDEMVMEFFKTSEKVEFKFNQKDINYLYMNGVIAEEKTDTNEYYLKFSCPFVQKSLFDYFSNQIFSYLGQLIHPLDAMKDAVDEETLNIPNIIKRYQAYLKKNYEVFFKDVPRRKTDLKIYEAVYHFNLYRYLYDLLRARGVEVVPQFPTGNGKIDLILKYREKIYALELKSFTDMYRFERGIEQAAEYGRQLGLKEIVFLVFVELSQEEAKPLEQTVDRGGIKVITLPVAIL